MNERDIAARATGEPMLFPGAEELRMLRAIALFALLEAARQGTYSASFRGFRVQALRQSASPVSGATVKVRLFVSLGGKLVERGVVAVHAPQPQCHGVPAMHRAGTSVAGEIEPIAGAMVM
ncbi:MAG: hypothetical protein IH606_13435 [Burkholderiales bacterium]|nr:hypothetical protein [Burkholderiales bacterium]